MDVRYERDANGMTTIAAEVPAEVVDDVYQQALKRLRRHVNVPGFRPGRVPPKLVEGILGPEPIAELAEDILREQVIPEAMAQVPNLVTLEPADVTFGKIERGRSCELTVKVLTAVVELGDYQGTPVEQYRAEVRPEEARSAVDELHREEAHYRDADHTDVRAGDHVVFSVRIVRDGFLVNEYDEDDPLRVQIGNNSLSPNIDEQLVGLSAGQRSTFEVGYPEDYHEEDLRGATAEFTVGIQAIQTRESLEEFVRRTMGAESVDEAVEGFGERLKRQRESTFRIQAREAAVATVVAASVVELPKAHLDAAVMEEVEEFEERLKEEGVAEADPEAALRIRERVEGETRREVVLRAIAQAEKLTVESDDLREQLAMMSLLNRVEPRLMVRRLEEEGLFPEVVNNARLRKAAELVLERAEVTVVDPPEGEEAPAVAEAAVEAAESVLEEEAPEEAVAAPEDEPCP